MSTTLITLLRRFDLSLAVKTGKSPLLMPEISWKAHLVHPVYHDHDRNKAPYKTPHTLLDDLCPIPDARLVNIWTDLSGVCRSFNLSLQTGRKVEMLLSSEVLTSVMYRLLRLEGEYYTTPMYGRLYTEDIPPSDDDVSFVSPTPSPTAASTGSSFSQLAVTAGSSWSASSIDFESCHNHNHSHNKAAEDLHTSGHRFQDSPCATLGDEFCGDMTARAHEHELTRLGMLAFTTTVFFDAHGLDTEYRYLYKRLSQGLPFLVNHLISRGEHIISSPHEAGSLSRARDKLCLWTLYIVYIALSTTMNSSDSVVADGDHFDFMEWLHKTQLHLRAVLGLRSWSKTREVLRSILWVDNVHDGAGKRFFDWKESDGARWQGVFRVERHAAGVVV